MLKNLLSKLKQVKNIELYIVGICALIVVLFVAFRGTNSSAKSQIDTDYSCFVENKIQGILEKIDGCGKTKVAVLCDTSKNNFDSDNYSKISFVNGVNSGINEASQNIIGVVIAAEGADDPIVKYKIVKTVVTLLAVDSSCVQVFTYIS